MSQVEQMKVQLHNLADQSRQGAASLAGFKQRFEQASQQVQVLIRGTATRADQDIATTLDAAAKSVDQACSLCRSPKLAAEATPTRSNRPRRTCHRNCNELRRDCSMH